MGAISLSLRNGGTSGAYLGGWLLHTVCWLCSGGCRIAAVGRSPSSSPSVSRRRRRGCAPHHEGGAARRMKLCPLGPRRWALRVRREALAADEAEGGQRRWWAAWALTLRKLHSGAPKPCSSPDAQLRRRRRPKPHPRHLCPPSSAVATVEAPRGRAPHQCRANRCERTVRFRAAMLRGGVGGVPSC